MAADGFTWILSYASDVSEECAVRETKYGDGYTQTSGDGINNITEVWNIVLDKRTLEEINSVLSFLRNLGGYTSFLWTPPDGVQGSYLCKTWKRTFSELNSYALTCTFRKVNVV